MCKSLTIVAQVGDYQYLACCEHGSIYLGWYYGTFHLRPVDFMRAVQLLERSTATPDFTQLNGERCCLVRQKNGCFQLWLGNVALFLPQAELPRLIELVRAGVPALERVLSQTWGKLWPRVMSQHYHATNRPITGTTFGVN